MKTIWILTLSLAVVVLLAAPVFAAIQPGFSALQFFSQLFLSVLFLSIFLYPSSASFLRTLFHVPFFTLFLRPYPVSSFCSAFSFSKYDLSRGFNFSETSKINESEKLLKEFNKTIFQNPNCGKNISAKISENVSQNFFRKTFPKIIAQNFAANFPANFPQKYFRKPFRQNFSADF